MSRESSTKTPSLLRTWFSRLWFWVVMAGLTFYVFRTVNPVIDLDAPSYPAVDFELPTLEGDVFRLADERGKPVVLNFWATWCPPCRAEIPGFIDLQDEYGDDVRFVGVALDEDGFDAVRDYVEARGINYPITADRWRLFSAYGGTGTVPTTYLIDADGQVRYMHTGIITKRSLRRALDQLLPAP